MTDDSVSPERPLGDIVVMLRDLGQQRTVNARKVIAAFGHASFTPAMLVPAFLVASPLSGIPLFSTICGLTIALVAAQMIFRRDHLWLPGFVLDRSMNGARLLAAVDKMAGLARWLDDKSRPRFRVMMHRPLVWVPQSLCLLFGLAMPVLELVPFSSSILGLGVILLSVGLMVRDGAFFVAGACVGSLALLIPLFGFSRLVT
ncbi:Uncharacterized conserved protein [Cognatiyoonia koreensis]|uniref:Uncharacterized conserved protein n=1 Tax=Cognatiyoonia koreensis TaxID=364200 RepID=A0A1I0RXR5_9RHOB|nr:exopolysaccharide biosynthesis protein [Cognatiyoonia koreensis]SEW46239.1 Uncharacterized conserved protein [Cognatiyoonia koreensis]